MQFLKTLFWVLVAVALALVASRNWSSVTLNLWGDIQADIKIPILVLIAFLLGWLPTYLVMRGKLWALQRRVAVERPPVIASAAPTAPIASEEPAL